MAIVSATASPCKAVDNTKQIEDYQRKFHVKMVVMYASPSAAHGTALVDFGTSAPLKLSFASGTQNWTTGYLSQLCNDFLC